MYSNEKKINKLFFYWICISLILVFSIIIVGGLTRLTDSGLSITKWELFEGILPPLNKASWENYFEHYKQIPQYKLLNFNMTLEEFKVIFIGNIFTEFLLSNWIIFFNTISFFHLLEKLIKNT